MSEANLLLIRVSIGATQKNPSRQNQKRPPTLKEAIKGDKTLSELAQRFEVHANQIVQWKKALLERADELFEKGKRKNDGPDISELHAKIGELTMENDFLACALGRMGTEAND
jgi:transposase-like protein